MKILTTLFCIVIASMASAKNFSVERWVTKNGATVIFYPAMEVPMLDVSLAFSAGSARDGNHFGLSALTNTLLNQGNAGLNADAIADSLEDTGAQYDGNISRDMAILNIRTLSKPEALSKAIASFAKIAAHPDFPKEAFEREKKQQLIAIKQSFEAPEEIANQTFFKALYQNHPYAHPVNGIKETVEAIDREQVLTFYKDYYVAKNAILVMAGAISSKQAHQIAEDITKDLSQGSKAPDMLPATALKKAENIHIPFPASQTMIRLGQLGITHQDPDYFPLMVGNYILGGNALTSILGLEVRAKQGLTYGIYSQFAPMIGTGPFMISLSTRNEQAAHALNVSKELLIEYLKKGPDEQQLLAAKQYMTGNFALSLASNRSIANTLLKMAFYGLPEDYLQTYTSRINQVDKESIKKAMDHHIQPALMLAVTVGQS